MTRVKSGKVRRAKHKKILLLAKGYRGARSKLVRTAKEAVMHAGSYAYAGRKDRKRQKKQEWILNINSALKTHSISYSGFFSKLKEAKIDLNRKTLSELIVKDRSTFDKIVDSVKTSKPIAS
ncbi:MAG: 50S ribosomal protein L20 [Candidatus Woykebacteria bacterium]